jgi:hypothetical protein
MSKLNKESVLPLASMLVSPYTMYAKEALEKLSILGDNYYYPSVKTSKSPLTKKQAKSRAKNKTARKARKKNKK